MVIRTTDILDTPTLTVSDLAAEAVTRDLLGGGILSASELSDAPDGYEFVRKLGRGGGGVVYLARDLQLDRSVALKFLLGASPADVERFRREARFAARLESDAIVPVYALGDHSGGPYIVMQ